MAGLFRDDHGRRFAEALDDLDREFGGDDLEPLLARFTRETGAFGRPRENDPGSALRLLALDGRLTDALGAALDSACRPDLDKLTRILTGTAAGPADN